MLKLSSLILALSCILSIGQGYGDSSAAYMLSTSTLRRGLVGYWRLEESSGTRYDCSSKGNHLTANNSPGQSAGKVGNCSTFSGASSQSLSVTDNGTLPNPTQTNFSVAAWVYLTNKLALEICVAKSDTTSGDAFALFYYNTPDRFAAQIGSASTVDVVQDSHLGSPATNTWYFLFASFTKSNSNLVFSVNNGTADSGTITHYPTGTTQPLSMGRYRPSGTPFYLTGKLDEVGIWNRVLTAAEITYLYNAGLGTHFPWAHP